MDTRNTHHKAHAALTSNECWHALEYALIRERNLNRFPGMELALARHDEYIRHARAQAQHQWRLWHVAMDERAGSKCKRCERFKGHKMDCTVGRNA